LPLEPIDPAAPPEWQDLDAHMMDRLMRNFEVGGMAASSLEELLDRCRREGVAVVLVAPPVASTHRQYDTPQTDATFRRYIDGLRDKYGCPFFDLRSRLDDVYFRDHHHANSRGRKVFSALFAREVLAPQWWQLATTPREDPPRGAAAE
jgi:hypothetical protein